MFSVATFLALAAIANVDAINWRNAPSSRYIATDELDNAGFSGQRTFSQQMIRMNQTAAASAMTRHTKLPEGPLHDNIKVLYGVFTSGGVKFRRKLDAQMNTWAAKAADEGRFIAIGGRDYPHEALHPGVIVSANCSDAMGGLSCKEAHLIAEGAKRNVDWIFIIGEDNYVDTKMLEEKLRSYSPDEFHGLGCTGCGKFQTGYGTDVSTKGSFCGGCGYALSKLTVHKLMTKGLDNLISEYGGRERQSMPNDMNTGNAIMKRGGKLKTFAGGLEGNPTFSLKHFKVKLHDNTIVYHYMVPEEFMWLHAVKTNASLETIANLQSLAFDEVGCAKNPGTMWQRKVDDCRSRHGEYPF